MPYIIGYGSLIEQASRMKTTPSAMYVLPARAPGFVRGWWARTGAVGFSTTFAGAIPEKASSVNGVVYAVSKEELEATNQREQGYTPTDITDTVQILGGSYMPADKVWIYTRISLRHLTLTTGKKLKRISVPGKPLVFIGNPRRAMSKCRPKVDCRGFSIV